MTILDIYPSELGFLELTTESLQLKLYSLILRPLGKIILSSFTLGFR